MGIFSTAFRSEPSSGQPFGSRFAELMDSIGFSAPGAALRANGRTALTLPAFYNGVNIIAGDIAMLPKGVFKKDGDRREKYATHPAYRLISQQPNKMMNAFDFWKIVRIATIIKGNAYAEIIRNSETGMPEELVFLHPDDVEILEEGRKLYYRYKGRVISGDDMLHFKGFSLDGKKGIGVITFAAAQLGVSLESQVYAGDIYKNKGVSYGIIETDKVVSADAKKAISEGVATALGRKDPHRVAMIDENFKYKPISVTPAESLFLENNKQAAIEIARWLNLAPHKLKDLGDSNYSNIYQQSIEHVQYTLMPWITSDEQELNNKLFSEAEQGVVYTKFNIAFLLRGDLEMKQKFYTSMVYAGIYTRNEVRALEDMNPIDGLDDILQPVNMQALSVAMELLKDQKDGNKPK